MNELDNLYFKDCFSKLEDKINLAINQINATCIVSNNDNFHLDSDGNLTVKTIRTLEQGSTDIDYTSILNKVYPIGSIYTSINETNPTTLFGGVWEEFGSGRTLVGFSNETEFNALEKTGGNKSLQSHAHTGNTTSNGEHTHTGRYKKCCPSGSFWNVLRRISLEDSYDATDQATNAAGSHSHAFTTNNTGEGNSGNLQPFIVVRFWKRIS